MFHIVYNLFQGGYVMNYNDNDWNPNSEKNETPTNYTETQQGNDSNNYQHSYNDSNNNNKPEPTGSDGMAIASLILGILSIPSVFCCCPIFAGLGLIFGILSKGNAPQRDSKATIGIITSIIGLVLIVFYVVIVILIINASGGWENFINNYSYSDYENSLMILPLFN